MATLLARGQITIAAIKDGAVGKDAVSYSVQFSIVKELVNGSMSQLLYVIFTKSVGSDVTSGTIDRIGFNGKAKVYVDGVENTDMSDLLSVKYYPYIDIGGDFAEAIADKKNLSVELLDTDNRVVASNIFFFAKKGDKGDQGKKGTDGKDAISVLIEDTPLVFDTNDDGIVSPDISKLAKVKIMRGNRNVSDECSDVYSRNDMCVNCKCGVMQENGYISVSILGNNITKNDVIVNGVIQGKVSATSGYAVAQVAYDGVTYFAQVPFSVNVAKFTGVVAFNNKQYESKFTLITKRLDNTPTNNDLTKAEARITQTAREISLSVSEKAMGRRNLLVGSAARRQGEGWTFMSGDYYNGLPCESIEINSGHEGVNAIHCRTKQTSNSYYNSGFHWIGTFSSQGNIKIEKGKSYTLSFWAKAFNSDYVYFISELIWQGSATDNSRPVGYAGPKGFSKTQHATKNNTWTLFKVNIEVPSDASYEYVEVNIFARAANYILQDAYICKPMLEEGDYNGWTLSEQDYDYIGGNLLDNTRTLTVGGNLDYVDANTIISQGFGYDSAVAHVDNSSGSSYKEILLWETTSGDNISFQKGNDYLLSFLASGSGKMICYLFCHVNNTSSIYSENNQGDVMNNSVDGCSNFTLSSGWKRYWVHFRVLTDSPLPTTILMRASIGTNVYIAQPKLEEGAVVTEYTERKSDLVDKATLKKAGIEIKSDEVILYGDKIRVDNNGQTAAMFIGGKLNAAFIDADKIEVKHLWAKSNDGASKVGYFGNTEESACKLSDGTLAPLFIGGDTAAKSPFYVTSNGAMHATSGYIGGFSIINDGIISSAGGNEMRINTSYIKFHNEQHGITNIVGANWGYGIDYTAQQIKVEYDHPTKLTYMGSQATANQMNVGLYVSASGTKHQLSRDSWLPNSTTPCGNHAIFCDKGDFAGFRPCFRKITASQTLTKYDVFLEVDGTWKQHNDVTGKDTEVSVGSVTITLPKDPEIGQMYWILRGSKYNYTLKTTDGTQIDYPGGKGTSVTLTTYRDLVCVIFNGEYWRLIWRIGVV